jgi:signal peptidase II
VQERGTEPALSRVGVHRWAFVGALMGVIVVVDQLTKWWALEALADGPVELFWTLRLRLVFNQGAAFGLGSRFAPLIAIAALVIVGVLLRSDRLLATRWGAIGVALVAGGAIGNLVDRAFRPPGGFLGGAVVDFVDLQWWPVFNVADVAVTSGAVVLAVVLGRSPEPEPDADVDADAGSDAP